MQREPLEAVVEMGIAHFVIDALLADIQVPARSPLAARAMFLGLERVPVGVAWAGLKRRDQVGPLFACTSMSTLC